MTDTTIEQADTAELAARLNLTAQRIAEWRLDAKRLKDILAVSHGPVDKLVLLDVEETSGAIYREIAAFDALVADIDKQSHAAAGLIAEVGDSLRLALMDITELGTSMYSRESVAPLEV
jgi:hypothetical protein